ncbi:MAG: 6-hydroxymethylpterin diphosphokinase MptE-like protein [Campylobacterota bacterium]|nr:6-hydroxymethylpterin diphosphokinase MptE-like protein [Campylobacterota bacterium]
MGRGNIHQEILDRYLKNLGFLKSYDLDLFNRLEMISEALRTKKLPQRYDLSYIEENSTFDIYDNITKTYILNRKPSLWQKYMVENTSFDTNNLFATMNFHMFDSPERVQLDDPLDELKINKNLIADDISRYTSIFKESIYKNNDKKIKEFDKFLFVGTLHGIHINDIVNKIGAKNYFICEENLEIFRLSLFLCDYTEFINNGRTVVFSIMDNESNFTQKYDIFFQNSYTQNILLKYSSTNVNVDRYFNKINAKLLEKNPFLFTYRRVINEIVKKTSANFNQYKTINFNRINSNLLNVENVLLLGPGPTLEKNIKWIKVNQNKFIIIALAGTLDLLYKNGIHVDVITSVDSHYKWVYNQISPIKKVELDKIIKLFSITTHDNVFEICGKDDKNLYTFETLSQFQENNLIIDGITIGEVTFKLLLLFRIKNLYMIGMDLSVNQETNNTHVSSYIGNKIRDDIVMVEGNLKPQVKTINKFYRSIFNYTGAIKQFKKEYQNIYNLSQDGVFFADTIPTDINTLKFDYPDIDKELLKKQIKNNFDKISEFKLNNKEKELINQEIVFVDEFILYINKIQKNKIKDYYQLKEKTDKTFYNVMATDHTTIKVFYEKFYATISRYIFFIFNDQKLYNDKKLLNEFKDLWAKHLTELLKEYKNSIETLVN